MVNNKDWRHKSVNERRLNELKVGQADSDFNDSAVHLFDKPLIEYLNDGENPRFVLAARKKAPKFSGPNPPSWGGKKVSGMAMHLVTDSRWLIVVGQKAGDDTFEISLDDVTSITYKTGYIGHKINITTDKYEIEIPIGNMHDEKTLDIVTKYCQNPSNFDPTQYPSIKIEWDKSSTSESSVAESIGNARQKSVDAKRLESSVAELIRSARHKSVDESRLTELKSGITGRYLYDKPLIEYLEEDEQPNYILASRQKAPKFSGPNSPSWSGTNLRGMAMHLITDKRWLIVAGDKPNDQTFEIPLTDVTITDYSTGRTGHKINIEIPDYSIAIPIGNMYGADEVEAAVQYVRASQEGMQKEKIQEVSDEGDTPFENEDRYSKIRKGQSLVENCLNCQSKDIWFGKSKGTKYLLCGDCGKMVKSTDTKKPIDLWEETVFEEVELEDVKKKDNQKKDVPKYPIEIINRDKINNNLYAKLTVPTKSSGATFTSQGWNVGGDIIRRTSSKGKIKENSWQNYVKKFRIHKDHVEIGITHGDLSWTSDNRIHQHIRINISDISDVRQDGKGFVFEAAGDVYQFKLTRKGKLNTASRGDANEAVNFLKKTIRDAPDKKEIDSSNEDDGPTGEYSAAEKLSQIKELHDQDVLTDEEFQKKKEELLDQI